MLGEVILMIFENNGNRIASLINQTRYQVQIDAPKIYLNGYITISSLIFPVLWQLTGKNLWFFFYGC